MGSTDGVAGSIVGVDSFIAADGSLGRTDSSGAVVESADGCAIFGSVVGSVEGVSPALGEVLGATTGRRKRLKNSLNLGLATA